MQSKIIENLEVSIEELQAATYKDQERLGLLKQELHKLASEKLETFMDLNFNSCVVDW